MKHPTVDDLLNNKGTTTRETVRPNIVIDEPVWDDFRYTLDYININRSTRIHAHEIIQASLVEFMEKAKSRLKAEEGSVNGYMMFLADRRLEKQLNSEKKSRTDSSPTESDVGDTLLYSRKTVKRKRSDDE